MAMSQEDFKKQLEYGKKVEVLTQQIFMRMGWYVIPKYLYAEKGAPCLLGMEFKYCVPDLDVACNGRRFWVETKRKRSRNFYPDTGFSKRLFDHYSHVQKITGSNVFMIFFDEKINKCYGNWLNNLTKKHIINVRGKNIEYPLSQFFENEQHILFPYPDAFKTISTLNSLNISLDGYEALKRIFNTNVEKMNINLATKQSKIIEYG